MLMKSSIKRGRFPVGDNKGKVKERGRKMQVGVREMEGREVGAKELKEEGEGRDCGRRERKVGLRQMRS